jgi:hypothetical protein
MAITLSNLLAQVKHHRTDLSGGEHLYALQAAARKIGSLALLKIQSVNVPTVIGQAAYTITLPAMDEDVAEEVVRIAAVHRADGSPLREANIHESGNRRGNTLDVGSPVRWMDRFGVLVVDPAPDAIQTLTVEVYVTPAITAEIVDLPIQAETVIVAGALYELSMIPGAGFNASLIPIRARRWVVELSNYQGSVALGTSGTPTMHIDSPYSARVRTINRGGFGWMV